ncbi:MAG: undecaprenyl-diphosphate phosphatase [Candidatus Zixiibacteriota bacterium]|nr:MAG: undecaprenyl-diphosphate phosphatase [candidate division Zixibacteria bacterium]
MSYLDALVLGVIQGLTEFLPVSSSGHLVLTEELLGVKQPGVTFEVILHVGTLLSVLIYFRSTILRLVRSLFAGGERADRMMLMFLVIGTIPAVVVGLLFKETFEALFSEPLMTSCFLILTGLILRLPRYVRRSEHPMSAGSAVVMGIGQALAILPGVSRSGSTIALGMVWGVKPSQAAEFSFLLAVPAILGAAVFNLRELTRITSDLAGPYVLGMFVSFLFGIVAVYLVLSTIKRGKFEYFAYYCFAAGLIGLYLFSR